MIKKVISKGKDGYRIKVWHTDRPEYWVRFVRLPDIEEARARQKSAEQMILNGTSTDDAGAVVRKLIELGFGKGAENIDLIGRTASVKRAYSQHGGVQQWHTRLSAAIATGRPVWVTLTDGRYREVHICRMQPSILVLNLHYIGGVLYWRNEKREPIGYDIKDGVLRLFYIGDQL